MLTCPSESVRVPVSSGVRSKCDENFVTQDMCDFGLFELLKE